MISNATTEVMRLVSTFVKRIDAELVQSAARNAEASVLAAHQRWLDEMATLGDLYAIDGLTGPIGPVDPMDTADPMVTADAVVPAPRSRELVAAP